MQELARRLKPKAAVATPTSWQDLEEFRAKKRTEVFDKICDELQCTRESLLELPAETVAARWEKACGQPARDMELLKRRIQEYCNVVQVS